MAAVTKVWIERQIRHLNSSIGFYKLGSHSDFHYEPTPGWYGFIAQGMTEALNVAMKQLADHIGVRSSPVVEEWREGVDVPATMEHDFASDQGPAGRISYSNPEHSLVYINPVHRHSHYVVGAILAHELAHHYLFYRHVRVDDPLENEMLTDVATVFLGLGKLTLNGYHPVSWEVQRGAKIITYTSQVGYLSVRDLAAVYREVGIFRDLPTDHQLSYLNPQSIDALRKAGVALPKRAGSRPCKTRCNNSRALEGGLLSRLRRLPVLLWELPASKFVLGVEGSERERRHVKKVAWDSHDVGFGDGTHLIYDRYRPGRAGGRRRAPYAQR